MPYVQRDRHGRIASLFREPRPEAVEYLAGDDHEVRVFLGGEPTQDGFERLDAGFVRVLEDLVDLMLERHLLILTDLPAPAQEKWLARKRLRQLTDSTPLPLPDTGFADIIDDTAFGKL